MALKEKLLDLNFVLDNEYLDKYCELIILNKHIKKEKFKTQLHHIIPRYYYRYNHLEIDDSIENTVYLSHYDHLLAHFLLCKCCEGKYLYANEFALNRLLKIGNKQFNLDLNSELSDSLKVEISEYLHEAMLYKSELTKKQHLEGKANVKGLIENGFSSKGRIFVVNKDEDRHLILPEELDHYISLGYKKGKYFHKESNPDFGRKFSKERRENLSKSRKGKGHPQSEESKNKIRQKLKGRKMSWGSKVSKTLKSKKYRWWTNGITEKLSIDCPEEGYYLGKLKRPNRHWYNNGILEVWQEEKPEGFLEGRLPQKKKN